MSTALANGRMKLAALRLERQKALEEQERHEEELRNARRKCFERALNKLFPDSEVEQFIQRPAEIVPGPQCLEIHHPSCLPIRFEVYIHQDGNIQLLGPMKFTVPGVRTIMPCIDEDNEIYPGEIEINFGLKQSDDGMALETVEDLELALAIAEEHYSYFLQQNKLIFEQQNTLIKAQTDSTEKIHDFVYEPLEDSIESLINMAELIRLVRGMVDEALEERNR